MIADRPRRHCDRPIPPVPDAWPQGFHYLAAPYTATTRAVMAARAEATATAAGQLWTTLGARVVLYAPTVAGNAMVRAAPHLRGLGWEDWWRPVSAQAVLRAECVHVLLLDGWERSIVLANVVRWTVEDRGMTVRAWRLGTGYPGDLKPAPPILPGDFSIDASRCCSLWHALP